eukprot:GFUD01035344.1.p1 GENE.GFUD01035344.1~~GFUD01035344.1.p1  ORF type:complete len:395 (+),score=158.33 GFUD01035344.1:106-1185(+)
MVVSKDLADKLSMLDKVGPRQYMVQSLISSYKLMNKFMILPLVKASVEDLLMFHSSDYVKFLTDPTGDDEELYGLGYDCPLHPSLLSWCLTTAGGSLTAASCLVGGQARVVVNWGGGWHHAQRGGAAGFCYVNDVVLAVHRLQERFRRILYIDLDVHHGDGVENAFSATDKVVTFSIHKYEPGYFPGTGDLADTGTGRGRHHSINIPLQEGVTDQMYRHVFCSLFPSIITSFMPDCIVLQCGADCLAGDPMGGFNLTPASISACVDDVLAQDVPVLLLGGGGYNLPNTAKLWTLLTARVAGMELDTDIPDCDHFFTEYGPDFQLGMSRGCVRNRNVEEEVDRLIRVARENIVMIKSTNK